MSRTHKPHGLIDHSALAGKVIVSTQMINRGLLQLNFFDGSSAQISYDLDEHQIEVTETVTLGEKRRPADGNEAS